MSAAPFPADAPPRMPGWVKVFLAIGAILVLLVVLVLVFGGSEHGPGRHSARDHDPEGVAMGPGCRAAPFAHGGGSGVRVDCAEESGTSVVSGSFACAQPDHGGLQVEWALTTGAFRLTVRDAVDGVVYADSHAGSGDTSASFAGGMAGPDWWLELDPDNGFLGRVSLQAFCAGA